MSILRVAGAIRLVRAQFHSVDVVRAAKLCDVTAAEDHSLRDAIKLLSFVEPEKVAMILARVDSKSLSLDEFTSSVSELLELNMIMLKDCSQLALKPALRPAAKSDQSIGVASVSWRLLSFA